jgi:hypothetical protein
MRMGKTESTLHAPRSTHLLPDATPPRKREGRKGVRGGGAEYWYW